MARWRDGKREIARLIFLQREKERKRKREKENKLRIEN
jgi:hypothetical protein